MIPSRILRPIVVCLLLGLVPRAGAAATASDPRWTLSLENQSGFVLPNSRVRVRENQILGTELSFGDLGINTTQLPTLTLGVRIQGPNALRAHLRYFHVTGETFLTQPIDFNGATLAAGQIVRTAGDWYSGELLYERRMRLGESGWRMNALAGAEYTYINITLNGGHAAVTPASAGSETEEDFYRQELPLPILGLELSRSLNPHVSLSAAVQGGWINHWNSQREEGGTVFLSQSELEAHLRAGFAGVGWLGPAELMVGLFYYHFSQWEDSDEDGNYLRWSAWGPEAGLVFRY